MAARKRKVALSDDWKANIQAAMIMKRLYSHALGEADMERSQIDAAKVVLAKILPDLKAMDITVEGNITSMTPEEREARIIELQKRVFVQPK